MKYFLSIFLILLSASSYGETSFNSVSVLFSQVDYSVDSMSYDGSGNGMAISVEIGNQFYFSAGKINGDFSGQDPVYNYDISSDLNLIGFGRYSKITEKSKLSYFILTGDPKQINKRKHRITGRAESGKTKLTRGQRIGVSYIYDASNKLSLSGSVIHDDFGTFEDMGYGIATTYYFVNRFGVGLGYTDIADSSQVSMSFTFNFK